MNNVVIVGAGVAGVNAATKLVDNNFKGKITIIDMLYCIVYIGIHDDNEMYMFIVYCAMLH